MPFVPRGTVLHEIINLPVLWWRLSRLPAGQFAEHRLRYGRHPRQYMLVLRPQNPAVASRVLLFFHGGAWRLGRPEYFRAYARPFLDRGFTVVMPSVRRTPRYSYPAIREDLSSLLKRLDESGLKNGNDQIVIGGMSSGANLAALTLFNREELHRAGWSASDFAGALFLGAPLDLDAMPDSEPLFTFSGPRHSPQFRHANPASYLEEPPQRPWPVLCIHGSHDGLVPQKASARFIEQLQEKHQGAVEYHVLDRGTHLDAVSWVYQDNTIRQTILNWIEQV